MKRQKLLFLAHRFPYPPNRGDRIRSYNMLRVLAEHFEISLGCTSDESVSDQQLDHMRQFCERIHVAQLPSWSRRARAGRALFKWQSLTEAMFTAPSLHREVQRWHQSFHFDKAIVFCSSMYPYMNSTAFRGLTKIVDLVDVDSEKWKQMSAENRFPMSWVYGREAKTVRSLERKIGRESKLATLVSDAEAQLYRTSVSPTCQVLGVSNGVDTEYFSPIPDGTEKQTQTQDTIELVFTGVLDYSPNVEGMVWFCKRIMPELRKQRDFRLKVVGRRPCSRVIELDEIDGVQVVGEVPDVRPYLHDADIAISPLKLARGIQNKVLEAMACGLPAVVTPQSAEGIDAESGKELWIADDSNEWIESLLNLADSPNVRIETGSAARELVEQHYSWSAKMNCLVRAINA
ncbi:TIGR03087 family PEP-CTERM/XrtA system glycosyltransferase [Rubripirellula sp.]|nr:TIGR03087 family PEP-CTERM/XrtA system glycosyltransferase [Rubripirellula sp.]